MTLIELRQERATLIDKTGELLRKAAKEGRGFTPEEERSFTEMEGRATELSKLIDRTGTQELREQEGRESTMDPKQRMPHAVRTYGECQDRDQSTVIGFDQHGNEVRAFRPDQSFATTKVDAESARASLGGTVRGLLTGDWRGFEAERRALSEGDPQAGGFLAAAAVSERFIDLARSRTRVVEAGAQTVRVEGSELTIARLTSDPTATWRQENATIPSSDVTFSGLTLRPKTVAGYCKFSVELSEDASNLGQIVENALSEALGLALDRAALRGSGAAAEPLGIANYGNGVQTITSIGTPAYADWSSAVEKVATVNGTANATIMHPRDLGTLDRLVDSTTQPLRPLPSWETLTKLATTQCRTTLGGGGAESEAFTADFTQLLIGMRTRIRIEVSRLPADSSNSAFSDLQVWARAYLRADIGLARPNHFVYMSGITV